MAFQGREGTLLSFRPLDNNLCNLPSFRKQPGSVPHWTLEVEGMDPQRGSSFIRTIRNQPSVSSILSHYHSFPPFIPVSSVRISHHKLYHHHQRHSPLLERCTTTNRSSDTQRLSELRALFSTLTTATNSLASSVHSLSKKSFPGVRL
ncbi:hypothetical protein HO133_000861 [Letharia lupina]|uniref:Uncharacterized protein n=1 Tax=Letharia lupina TaxID=560253 RepID=A0A8H6CGL5_9LECA|nr:uncharacterized protein HO133_000861 [Letharia lupina]KAF6222811.1 hypothetical protein HO133_000861 [Letharia lupina]